MRLDLTLALLVATTSAYTLVQTEHQPRKFYIIAGDEYAEVSYEKAYIVHRVLLGGTPAHGRDAEWTPTLENLRKLEDRGQKNGTLEFMVLKANPNRYFVFDAPQFAEIDQEKYVTLSAFTANQIIHFVDENWNQISYKYERLVVRGAIEDLLPIFKRK
ncbi:unnamed protein product, partial [Mesorhabditis spiculigera]